MHDLQIGGFMNPKNQLIEIQVTAAATRLAAPWEQGS
jgi:hypothetical protein